MKFSVRAATLIAAFLVVGLSGYSTPGRAIEPAKGTLLSSFSLADPIGPLLSPVVQTAPTADPAPAPSDPIAQTAETIETSKAIDQDGDDADRRSYATLAAAVAAQAMPAVIDADLACLAGTIYFESKGEPLMGQLAVAQVVMNRAASGRFPRTICSVVTQRGQFSFVRGGRIPAVSKSNAAYRTALAVAQVAMDSGWETPAGDALFFHARRVAPNWGLKRVAAIGQHIFYR